jgi:hypothetical protein
LSIKENGTVITPQSQCLFKQIVIETKGLAVIKKGNLLQDCLLDSSVELTTVSTNEIWYDLNSILEVIN